MYLPSGNPADAATAFLSIDYDGFGRIEAVADALGQTSQYFVAEGDRYTYSAYGKVDDLTGNPIRYTGRRLDAETGLYYYRARYYSPTLGRFLQTDPIGYDDDFNLYAYTRNDPVNLIDPTGRAPNQAGAARWRTIQAELRANPSLSALSANHTGNTNRYFFTDKYGWVDVRHFGAAASMTASGTWGWVTEGLGYANEVAQWTTEWGNDYRSGFSPEDLPSNSAGADFGKFFRTGSDPVDVAFAAWVQAAGARDPSDPKSGYQNLPATDPSVRGGAARGSSNVSSDAAGHSSSSSNSSSSTSSQNQSSLRSRSCGSSIISRNC